MKVNLGILVQFGTNKKVEVESTTPGASFIRPPRVFIFGSPNSVTVEMAGMNRVVFTSLNRNIIRVFADFDSPTEDCLFRVTYDPSDPPSDHPAIFVWNFALDLDSDATSWDQDAEKIVHLAGTEFGNLLREYKRLSQEILNLTEELAQSEEAFRLGEVPPPPRTAKKIKQFQESLEAKRRDLRSKRTRLSRLGKRIELFFFGGEV